MIFILFVWDIPTLCVLSLSINKFIKSFVFSSEISLSLSGSWFLMIEFPVVFSM